MKTRHSKPLVLIISLIAFMTSAVAQVPRMDSVTPSSGSVGTSVTIAGAHFSSVPADNIVYFGAVRAVVTSASADSLAVIVPASATHAPITVTVGGRTAWANAPFTPTFSSSGRLDASSFAPQVDLAAAPLIPDVNIYNPGTLCVAVGDLDGDGKPDVVAGNGSALSLSVFRNTSTAGSIASDSFAPALDLPEAGTPRSLALGDVDGDGRLDIVAFVGADEGAKVSLRRNISTPGNLAFAPSVILGPIGSTVFQSQTLVIRDLDGDGRPELILSSYPGLFLVQNNCTPGTLTSGSFGTPVLFETASQRGIAVGDLDGDGRPDIAMANRTSPGSLSIFRNTTTPGLIDSGSLAPRVDFATPENALSVEIFDLNNDGKPDVLVLSFEARLSMFENIGSPGSITTSSFAPRVDVTTLGFVQEIVAADLDGDGKPDFAEPSYAGPGFVAAFQNAAAVGQSLSTESLADPLPFGPTDPNVVAGISFQQWYRNFGGFYVGNVAMRVALGDLDGDGQPDLVVSSEANPFISILRNTVSPCSAPPPSVVSASSIDGENIAIRFDHEFTCASALDKARYVVNGGAITVNSVAMKSADHKTVVLTVSGLSSQPNTAFTVTASGIQSCTQGAPGGGTATGHVQALTPLVSVDLGDPPDHYRPGSVYAWSDGTITVTAGGLGLLGPKDGGNFLYQPVTGDFDVKVRVSRLDQLLGSTSAGLMVRENLSAGSRNFNAVVVTRDGGQYRAGFRPAQDAAAPWGGAIQVTWPNAWLRLKREGQTFTAYYGDNGVNWEQFAQTTDPTPFATTALVGLVTSSSEFGLTTTADYKDFSLVTLAECTAAADCDDADPCTDDSCDSGSLTCVHTNNTASCNDGNACTQIDTCQAGTCVGANPVTCGPLDQCHDAGTCDTGTGICSNPAKADGAGCSDGNACTQTDTCLAGTCTGTNYSWSGFLQPVNVDGSSVFKLKSTIPVKFNLTGACADNTNLVADIYFYQVTNSSGPVNEAVSTSAADTGTVFRYSNGQYIFNLGTKGLTGGTWQLGVDLHDGVGIRTVPVGLRQ